MGRQKPFRGQLWGSLALVLVDEDGGGGLDGSLDGDRRYFDAHTMIRRLGGRFASDRGENTSMASAYGDDEPGAQLPVHGIPSEAGDYRRELELLKSSSSWRLTAPLRGLKRWVKGLVVKLRG